MGSVVAVLPGESVFSGVGVPGPPVEGREPQAARVSTRSNSELRKATNRCTGELLSIFIIGIPFSLPTTSILEGLFIAPSIAEINHEAVSMKETDLTGLSQTGEGEQAVNCGKELVNLSGGGDPVA